MRVPAHRCTQGHDFCRGESVDIHRRIMMMTTNDPVDYDDYKKIIRNKQY